MQATTSTPPPNRMTAAKSGRPPSVAVLLATDIYTFLDEGLIDPLDNFIKTEEDRRWVAGFMPAFLKSAQVDGKLWSAPFQRSTAVLYWNKKAFAEVGTRPREVSHDMGRDGPLRKGSPAQGRLGRTTRWGVGIPGNVGSSQWLFGALAAQNGATLFKEDGTQVTLTDPQVVEALQFWVDLSAKEGIHPPGIQEWGTTPSDFLESRIAMIWTTTGNLTNIKRQATFDFGACALSRQGQAGVGAGWRQLLHLRQGPKAKKEAAFKFVKFMTSDELQADWCVQTGYVAPRDGAWETETLKKYVRRRLQPPSRASRSRTRCRSSRRTRTPARPRCSTTRSARRLTGAKTPQKALADAQVEIDAILKPYRR